MHRADLMSLLRPAAALLVCALLSACQTMGSRPAPAKPVKLLQASTELPEDRLLDVGIEIFSPGRVQGESIEDEEVLAEIREAEARFMPVQLKNTMQRTGHWGLVRVVPKSTDAFEVLVRGEIVESDGERLLLRVEAYDATGRQWFSKFYDTQVGPRAYRRTRRGSKDAFQSVYTTIANDLARFKSGLQPIALREIKRVSELRFAADLAPEPFADYLVLGKPNKQGFRKVARLPAEGEPMLERVRRIRERDYMLIDTLDGYYDNFYDEMWDPYRDWRKFRSEEAESMREVESQATNQKLLGLAAIVGGVALAVMSGNSSSVNAGGLGTALAVGGTIYAKQGFDRADEVDMHEEAIRELGESFEAEVKPLVVEVEGETVELTGTASAQYAEWRKLLKNIYASETGALPVLETRPAVYVDDDPVPGAPALQATPALPAQGGCGPESATTC